MSNNLLVQFGDFDFQDGAQYELIGRGVLSRDCPQESHGRQLGIVEIPSLNAAKVGARSAARSPQSHEDRKLSYRRVGL
jgi:hypothetical protein